jgi:hypothetical protein
MKDLPQHQKDIRWLYAWAKGQGLPAPTGDQATDFAERVGIMMFEANMAESRAREEAALCIFKESPALPR